MKGHSAVDRRLQDLPAAQWCISAVTRAELRFGVALRPKAPRLARDIAFRDALFGEAIDAFLQGDSETGKAVLRDLINGTVGFEKLARRIRRPSKSLHRMLGSRGNPTTENFFAVMHALQRETGVRLEVRVRKR